MIKCSQVGREGGQPALWSQEAEGAGRHCVSLNQAGKGSTCREDVASLSQAMDLGPLICELIQE